MRRAEMFTAPGGGELVFVGYFSSLINCFLIVCALSLTKTLGKMRNSRHLL